MPILQEIWSNLVSQHDDALRERLDLGSRYINSRRWDWRARDYVSLTVELFPREPEAYLQAYTLAMLSGDFLAAISYWVSAQQFNLTNEQWAGFYRDLAIALIKKRKLQPAEMVLPLANKYHQGDANLQAIYMLVQFRLRLAQGHLLEARAWLDQAVQAFDTLGATGLANEQWRFNTRVHQMRLANREHNWAAARRIRRQLRFDTERFTWRHRLATWVLLLPGGWRFGR